VEFVPGVKLVGEAFEEYWRKIPNIKRMEFYRRHAPLIHHPPRTHPGSTTGSINGTVTDTSGAALPGVPA
jgi:hypothetical protein